MNVEDIRDYCISLKGTEESFPFDEVTLVMKIGGKMYAIIPLDEPSICISVKCEPEKALELREKYESVKPGYHLNKMHWNTVYITPEVTKSEIFRWIKNSYELIIAGLPKKKQEEIKKMISS